MEINWHIRQYDVNRVKELIANPTPDGKREIRRREKKNLSENRTRVTPAAFWREMASARLTTQNPWMPGGLVEKLSKDKRLSLQYLRKKRSEGNVKRFIADTVGKLRFHNQIARDLTYNLSKLEVEDGEWKNVLKECNRLAGSSPPTKCEERKVARYIAKTFMGFGPKQSRNLLQMLGLTRYEIPIDSRLTKWLNEFDFPVELNASVLRSRRRYELVLDEIQKLCQKANKYPCIFDAAVFASQAPHTKEEM